MHKYTLRPYGTLDAQAVVDLIHALSIYPPAQLWYWLSNIVGLLNKSKTKSVIICVISG